MVFSVVETFENKTRLVSACPSTWLVNDILQWPPEDLIRKRAIEKEFAPDDTWIKMPCTILKTGVSMNIFNILK